MYLGFFLSFFAVLSGVLLGLNNSVPLGPVTYFRDEPCFTPSIPAAAASAAAPVAAAVMKKWTIFERKSLLSVSSAPSPRLRAATDTKRAHFTVSSTVRPTLLAQQKDM